MTEQETMRLRAETQVAFLAGDATRGLELIRLRLGIPIRSLWDFVRPLPPAT